VTLAVNLGWHDYEALGFPPQHGVTASRPEKGWVAISEHTYRTEHAKGGWYWLDGNEMTRVGKSIRLYYVSQLLAPNGANQSPDETILLPIAGTVGVVGAPSGVWFHVDQSIRNNGTSPIHVALSACGARPAPCDLDLAPGRTEQIASAPGERPFIFVTVPRGMAKQLAFSTVVHAGNWPAINIPALSENDFQNDRVSIPSVPTNARLNLRVWLLAAGSGTPVDVRVYSPRDGHFIAEKQFVVDRTGYFANGDLGAEFPQLAGEPVDIRIESVGTKVWAMMTTTDYQTGKIVLSLPR